MSTRKLAAILVTDIVGFSRLAGIDEERTLARLRALRGDFVDPAVAAHYGRIAKGTGDGSIVEFRSGVDAARCAIEVQNGLVERNAGAPPKKRIEFRVGIPPTQDAVYPTAITDANGKPFISDNRYLLHFDKDQTPHVCGF